ncbi:fluoride efflux transporter CrcB [Gracilibacillus alcaliphilus]|uniref:fluoride efflux transporter CrcB n=1 Tax=Gracilibacillus alcaliphilus TaxID=1401441 RepID=UPI00195D79C8|nr:fluoride efflux transporter CrcB [Gracilibacillus alcaliphilus]MBM7675928.1 CrcB protein [Gracilibacillus alcaliphilus]
MSYLVVAAGGIGGAILRFAFSLLLSADRYRLPFGTLLANIIGSSLLGFLYVWHQDTTISTTIWLLCGVGFCGAFTTYSTFSLEVIKMLQAKQWKRASLYFFGSITVSLLIFASIVYLLG